MIAACGTFDRGFSSSASRASSPRRSQQLPCSGTAALIAIALRAPVIVAMAVAALVTALLRLAV